MEEEKLLTYEELPEEIIKDPYKYICDFVEHLYPYTGRQVFEILSLIPCSLIINDMPYLSKTEKTNMNVLFLGLSGSAKSSIAKQFAKFTYFPLEGRSYTPAELENAVIKNMKEHGMFSLIIEDYATMSMDERINKIIEGVLGDEKIVDRHTTKKDVREHIEAIGLLCGIPGDLSDRITSGTLSRVICVVVIHDDEEHSKIGKHISDNLGKLSDYIQKEKVIKSYYNLLYEIQSGMHKEYPKIDGVVISQHIKDQIYDMWDEKTRKYRDYVKFNFFREEHDSYRMLISHCMLNYFNREKQSGRIIISQEDCAVAVNLMKRNLRTKYHILLSERMGKSVKNANEFNRLMGMKMPKIVKQLVPVYMKKRK